MLVLQSVAIPNGEESWARLAVKAVFLKLTHSTLFIKLVKVIGKAVCIIKVV